MNFSISELIAKKKEGLELTTSEIRFFVESVVRKNINEAQIGAMLMAIYIRNLKLRETVDLTKCMTESGEILKFDNFDKDTLVDKHSTGGVGDKISLVLAPALAACGLKVPMISGRGLEFTGGTLDKLESIPGFQVSLDNKEMEKCLNECGCFICGATEAIAPADGILYRMRDVTSTTGCPALIASSILSKKAAEGIGTLVLDVKYGKAAFVKSETAARELAAMMENIGKHLGLNVRAVVSEMNVPIGEYVGNALEVVEAVKCLRNEVTNSVTELVKVLGGVILQIKGLAKTIEEGKITMQNTLKNGTALNHFQRMLESQGVSKNHAEDLCKGDFWKVLPKANYVSRFRSHNTGFVTDLDASSLGKACWLLGAGRAKSEGKIEHSVGIVLLKVVGNAIEEDEPWIEVHHSTEILQPEVENLIRLSLVIGPSSPPDRASFYVLN